MITNLLQRDLFTEDVLLQVVGFDPSLRNWGIAKGILRLNTTFDIQIQEVSVITPHLPATKQVRQNSLDLEAARQLAEEAYQTALQAHAVFVEVPVGSQSARAMASYGICVGVLGALRAQGIPFFEVSPLEVKLASVGKKTASKQEMIRWALDRHPEANWPLYKDKGEHKISEAKAEHMADAIATIYAGVHSTPFRQMLTMR